MRNLIPHHLVNITDENEIPILSAEAYTLSVAENSAATTAVMGDDKITAIDDDNDILGYVLSGTGHENFAIDASGNITVAAGASLDLETTSSYNLIVTVIDGEGLEDTAAVTINLTNEDENPILNADTYTYSYTLVNTSIHLLIFT